MEVERFGCGGQSAVPACVVGVRGVAGCGCGGAFQVEGEQRQTCLCRSPLGARRRGGDRCSQSARARAPSPAPLTRSESNGADSALREEYDSVVRRLAAQEAQHRAEAKECRAAVRELQEDALRTAEVSDRASSESLGPAPRRLGYV